MRKVGIWSGTVDGPGGKMGCQGRGMDGDTGNLWSPRGIHGHTIVWTADMRPAEPTRYPWTYSSMDGQPTWDDRLWTEQSCPLGLGTCHHVGLGTIPYHTIPYHTYGYHVTMWGSAGTKEGRSDRRTGNYETGLSIRCYFHFVMKEHYFMDSMSNRTRQHATHHV